MKVFGLVITILFSCSVFAAATKDSQKMREQLRATLRRQLLSSSSPSVGEGGGDAVDSTGEGSAGNGVTDGGICFSAFNDVEVQGKGIVSMDSVKVGDYVRSRNGHFSRVFSLAHVDHNLETEFLQIFAEGLNKPLEITGKHILFASNKAICADEVTVGDMLDKNKVTKIKTVKRTGVYAPVTELGEIVVSGVRASSYPALVDTIKYHDQHTLIHYFYGPQRVICAYDFGLCENEEHTDGISNWVHWAMKLMEMSNEFIVPVQYFLLSLSIPVVSAAYGFEQMILSPISTLGLGTYMLYKMTKKVSN